MSATQSQNSSSIISSIYKSRKTVLDLMKKQGYNVEDYENFSINEVNSMKVNNQLDMLLEKMEEDKPKPYDKKKGSLIESANFDHFPTIEDMRNNNLKPSANKPPLVKRKIYIRYFLTKAIRPQNIQEMMDDLFNLEETLTKDDTLMIIVKDDMNETTTNLLKHIWEQDGIFIVIQSIKRLQFNILEHSLVPPHRVLSLDEVAVVKRHYNITDDTQFPDISRFDPVAQVIGIRPGQICEIIRPSKTAISAYYYRICI